MGVKISALNFIEVSSGERVYLARTMVSLPVARVILRLTLQRKSKGLPDLPHIQHFLVEESIVERLCSELLGQIKGIKTEFPTVEQALNHLRWIARGRGMSNEEIVSIDTGDNGLYDDLCLRAERFKSTLAIEPDAVTWRQNRKPES